MRAVLTDELSRRQPSSSGCKRPSARSSRAQQRCAAAHALMTQGQRNAIACGRADSLARCAALRFHICDEFCEKPLCCCISTAAPSDLAVASQAATDALETFAQRYGAPMFSLSVDRKRRSAPAAFGASVTTSLGRPCVRRPGRTCSRRLRAQKARTDVSAPVVRTALRVQAKIDSAACHAALKRSASSASASALKAQVGRHAHTESSVNSGVVSHRSTVRAECHAGFSSADSSSDRAAQGAQGNHGRTARRGIASGAALHSCAVLSKISCALRRGDDST
jgi:hypothetical protein